MLHIFHRTMIILSILFFILILSGCKSAEVENQTIINSSQSPAAPIDLPKVYGITLQDMDSGGTLHGQFSGQTLNIGTKVNELKRGLEAVIPYFEKISGAHVELSALPDDTFVDQITQDLTQKHQFDVVLMPIAFLHGFEQSGYIKDLTSYINNKKLVSPNLDLDDFIPSLLETYGYYKGKLYALPYKPDAQIFFYRKDLFSDKAVQESYLHKTGKVLKVPETMAELYETAAFFTKKFNPDSPTSYGFNLMGQNSWARWTFNNRLGAYGGKDVDKDFLPGFQNFAGVSAMQTYVELAKYATPDWKNFGWSEANDFFLQGDVAMMEQWPGLSKLAEETDSKIKGKVGYAIVPGVNGVHAPTLGGWAVAVVNNSKRTDMSELAYKFIEFITSKDMELLKIASGNDPTRISNYKRPEVAASNPIYPVLADSLANAKVLADLDVPFVTEKLNKIEENAIRS
ncbi:MAG: hypothetical protein JWM44_2789, partial [Bacilli bacterium]|nr:hypothetical protein [Bacilli bacterium]